MRFPILLTVLFTVCKASLSADFEEYPDTLSYSDSNWRILNYSFNHEKWWSEYLENAVNEKTITKTFDKLGFGAWVRDTNHKSGICEGHRKTDPCMRLIDEVKRHYSTLGVPDAFNYMFVKNTNYVFYNFDCKNNRFIGVWSNSKNRYAGGNTTWQPVSSAIWATNMFTSYCPEILRAQENKTKKLEEENELLKNELLRLLKEKNAQSPKRNTM
jgi:hypothetical protein